MLTRAITREQIAAAVGNNPRAIRLIEQLVGDVTQTIPNSVGDGQAFALLSAHPGATGDAQAALQSVRELIAQVRSVRAAPALQPLQDQIDMLRLEVHELRALLGSAIQQLSARASDAQALILRR